MIGNNNDEWDELNPFREVDDLGNGTESISLSEGDFSSYDLDLDYEGSEDIKWKGLDSMRDDVSVSIKDRTIDLAERVGFYAVIGVGLIIASPIILMAYTYVGVEYLIAKEEKKRKL